MSREKYKNLLKENDISDYLYQLQDLKYSIKTKIIIELLKWFSSIEVDYILSEYNNKYIKVNRVKYDRILNTLLGIGKRKFT